MLTYIRNKYCNGHIPQNYNLWRVLADSWTSTRDQLDNWTKIKFKGDKLIESTVLLYSKHHLATKTREANMRSCKDKTYLVVIWYYIIFIWTFNFNLTRRFTFVHDCWCCLGCDLTSACRSILNVNTYR